MMTNELKTANASNSLNLILESNFLLYIYIYIKQSDVFMTIRQVRSRNLRPKCLRSRSPFG